MTCLGYVARSYLKNSINSKTTPNRGKTNKPQPTSGKLEAFKQGGLYNLPSSHPVRTSSMSSRDRRVSQAYSSVPS